MARQDISQAPRSFRSVATEFIHSEALTSIGSFTELWFHSCAPMTGPLDTWIRIVVLETREEQKHQTEIERPGV